MFTPTHESVRDGSTVMFIADPGDGTLYLENESGDRFHSHKNIWRRIERAPLTDESILKVAYGLLGDGQGSEWRSNPEYTRGVVEMVCDLVSVDPDVLDKGGDDRNAFVLGMIYAAGSLA